jgi:MFS transporter, ACS family, hexuronate transporter
MNIKIKNLRWWIAGILALGTANSYIDRQSFPVVIDEIRKTIEISESQFGMLNFLFLFAYALMYVIGGKLLDVFGTRIGYGLLVIWWTIATAMQGLVGSILGFGVARFFLGLGEGGTFPASAKAVSEWFPAKERAFAFGIFNTGSSLGAIVAPPLIAMIVIAFSWRWVFFFGALLGVVWLVLWFIFYYNSPVKSKFVTKKEKEYIETGKEKAIRVADIKVKIKWIELFKFRSLNALMIAKFLTDSAWYFLIFWTPMFLASERGLDIKGIGIYAWIPWVFAAFGSFFGGLLSSYLIRKNITLDKSRKITLGISALLLPVSLLIVKSPLAWTIVFFSMAYMGHQGFSTLVQTMTADLFPSRMVGSVAGLVGFAGAIGGAIFNLISGILIQTFDYTLVFIMVGIMHPLSFIIILLMIKNIKPVLKI